MSERPDQTARTNPGRERPEPRLKIPLFKTAVLAAVLCAALGGCATDRAAIEMVAYVNQDVLRIAELERRPLERYASVTGDNYRSDQAVREALADFVVPYYGRFVDQLLLIRPEDEELKRLHGIYIQGAWLIYSGFKTKLIGLESGDPIIVRAGNREIEEGQTKTRQWREGLNRLGEKYRTFITIQ